MYRATDCRPPFALLDDATGAGARSRLYEDFAGEFRCDGADTLAQVWDEAAAAQAAGQHLVLLADYEWGLPLAGLTPGQPGSLRLLAFHRCRLLDGPGVEAWLAATIGEAGPPAAILHAAPAVTEAEFTTAIDHIQAAIRRGETYQVNYTFPVDLAARGDPLDLYRQLRQQQPVPYGAFIRLPDGPGPRHVLSLSPELFVRHENGELLAQPMKGTAAAPADPAECAAAAVQLASDPKNRAENLMITDLLRNDLGRIARPGSVAVPHLFAVAPWGRLLQMTSTVTARPLAGLTFPQLLRALFPCGSITGAPKHRTMALINELESRPRGLYTGAIGWVDAPANPGGLGNFCLSVTIRTLLLEAPAGDCQRGRLGLGAGITLDSEAAAEYAECLLKGSFALAPAAGFELFETMAGSCEGIPWLDRHLARLGASAARLQLPWDEASARQLLTAACAACAPGEVRRLRLALAAGGQLSLRQAPLVPLPAGPVTLRLAPLAVIDPLARHKTSHRRLYDEGIEAATAEGAFDTLFHHGGQLLEGGRSNVFVRLAGRWYTPPLEAGILPGVMRGVVLDDPAWQATERALTLADLARAEALMVCSALRGCLAAHLTDGARQALSSDVWRN